MQVIAGSVSQELANEISQELNSEFVIPEIRIFNDGEQYLRIPKHLDDEVLIVQSVPYPQATNLFELLNIIQTCRRRGVKEIDVFTPYLCYTRSDREVLDGEAVTILTVFKLLEASGVRNLFVIDIHNPEVIASTKLQVVNIYPIHALTNYFKDININDFQVIAPDYGARQRARVYSEALGLDYTSLSKYRDPETGEISLELGEAEIKCRKILLIDDIMSSGGSLIKAVSLLKVLGIEEIKIFVSHALSTAVLDRLHELGSVEVIATNSIPNLIGKLSVAKDLVRSL